MDACDLFNFIQSSPHSSVHLAHNMPYLHFSAFEFTAFAIRSSNRKKVNSLIFTLWITHIIRTASWSNPILILWTEAFNLWLYSFSYLTTSFESLFRESDPSPSSYYNTMRTGLLDLILSIVRVAHSEMARQDRIRCQLAFSVGLQPWRTSWETLYKGEAEKKLMNSHP